MSKRISSVIISSALFMEAVDTTIINTAIPSMAHSLNVPPVDLKIALISYLISLAVFIPISGWVADKYGIKRVFITALGFFTLSSLWCGFAQSLPELVLARTLQGLGGSFMLPVGRLILLRTFERHEFITTMNRVVMMGSLGLMLGPVLGGFITHYLSWHWIFWVNIPVGLGSMLLSMRYLKHMMPDRIAKLDKLGFILFGSGLAGLTFAFSAFSESEIPQIYALSIMLMAVILLAAYFVHSRKQPHPIVKMELFQWRTFRTSILGNLLARLGFGGVPFLLPLLLQISLHYSPQASGLLLAPIALGVFFVKIFTLHLLRTFGYKKLLMLNTCLVGLSLWSFVLIDMTTSIYLIGSLTFIFGVLISLQYSCMNSLAYAEISVDNLSSATSIVSTVQQLAQSFGVAASALMIRYFTPADILTPAVFHYTFMLMGMITLISIVIFVRLKPTDGLSMTKEASYKAVGLSAVKK